MAAPSAPNRWWITAATFVVMFPIGGIYAWSVFVDPLQQRFEWSWTQAMLPLMANVGMIFVGTIVGGKIQDRTGPRWVAVVGIVAYAGAVALAAFTGEEGRLWVLVLTYGVLGGVAVGVAYITGPAMIMKWFPDKRGMAAGIATMGFGAGALLTAPLARWLLDTFETLAPVFLVLAGTYLVIGLPFALVLQDPPADWDGPEASDAVESLQGMHQYSLRGSLPTFQFWSLTGMLFINVTIGIALITVAASAAAEVGRAGSAAAAAIVSIIGVANGLGRPGLAALSDRLGRMRTYAAMFAVQAVVFAALPWAQHPVLFGALAVVIGLCFGGGFGVSPAAVADHFGTENSGAILGGVIVAWSAAGVVGPLAISWIRDTTGSFDPAFYTFAGVALVSVALPLLTNPPADRQVEAT
jgi:MFS transporter, OFA family, oxalate/formate antiporter